MRNLILIKISSEKFKSRIKKIKNNNSKKLCRYFTLIYPKDYASDMVGRKCNDK